MELWREYNIYRCARQNLQEKTIAKMDTIHGGSQRRRIAGVETNTAERQPMSSISSNRLSCGIMATESCDQNYIL
jgi:hypothetical protein